MAKRRSGSRRPGGDGVADSGRREPELRAGVLISLSHLRQNPAKRGDFGGFVAWSVKDRRPNSVCHPFSSALRRLLLQIDRGSGSLAEEFGD